MRWYALFADLEGQWESLVRAERDAEIADLTRAELSRISWQARLRGQLGEPIVLTVVGAGRVQGRLDRIGADWLLVAGQHETLLPQSAVLLAHDLAQGSVADEAADGVSNRLTMVSVLRAITRDRSAVSITLRDGSRVVGTPNRVGQDWLDLAVHDLEMAARPAAVRERVTLPTMQLAAVRRLGGDWS